MNYSIEFRPAVLKFMKRLPRKDLRRIKKRIDDLSENLPNPATTKMKGSNSFHKIRTGDYRIIYEIQKDKLIILVVRIGHRKEIYRD